ncbi:hypothetical protein H6F84_12410 [Microcoleus sp. FACHB-84]|nr:hypothetical protein [Microcoleus sp. FACHB-84]
MLDTVDRHPKMSIEHSRLPHAGPQASSKPIVRLDSVNLKSQISNLKSKIV